MSDLCVVAVTAKVETPSGETAVLQCKTKGLSQKFTLAWSHGGISIVSNEDKYVVHRHNQTLLVHNAGRWQDCHCSNGLLRNHHRKEGNHSCFHL